MMNFMDGFWFGLGKAFSELLMGLGVFATISVIYFLCLVAFAPRRK